MSKGNIVTFPNGCSVISANDIDYDKIASESLKKDLIDWCKADRKVWLRRDLNEFYRTIYVSTRKARFNFALLDAETDKDVEDLLTGKKKIGLNMDTIKKNALIRYNIERIKMYGSVENCIAELGENVFNRLFSKPDKHNSSFTFGALSSKMVLIKDKKDKTDFYNDALNTMVSIKNSLLEKSKLITNTSREEYKEKFDIVSVGVSKIYEKVDEFVKRYGYDEDNISRTLERTRDYLSYYTRLCSNSSDMNYRGNAAYMSESMGTIVLVLTNYIDKLVKKIKEKK